MLKVILAIKKDIEEYVKTGKIKQVRNKQSSPKVYFDVDNNVPTTRQTEKTKPTKNFLGDGLLKNMKTFIPPRQNENSSRR